LILENTKKNGDLQLENALSCLVTTYIIIVLERKELTLIIRVLITLITKSALDEEESNQRYTEFFQFFEMFIRC